MAPKQRFTQFKSPANGSDKASPRRSGMGQPGASALSPIYDFPDRKVGRPPIATRGEPSTSPDVTASQLMQSMVMNDDDKRWYELLFKQQAEKFLDPDHNITHGFDVGLNCGLDPIDGILIEDAGGNDVGIFVRVPDQIVRQIEGIYPSCVDRATVDPSPMHVTVLSVGAVTHDQLHLIQDVVRACLSSIKPFRININGTGHFFNESQTVYYARTISPALTALRSIIRSSLQTFGINPADEPEGFVPHITLNYLVPGSVEPEIPIHGSWIADRVEIWDRGSPMSFKLDQPSCLACVAGCCELHGPSFSMKLEVNCAGGGAIRGAQAPLEPRVLPWRRKKNKKRRAR